MSGAIPPLRVDSSSAEEAGKDMGSKALSEPFRPGEKHDRGSAWDGLGARCRATLFRALPVIFSAWV